MPERISKNYTISGLAFEVIVQAMRGNKEVGTPELQNYLNSIPDTIKDLCIDFLLDRNKQLSKFLWHTIHEVMLHVENLKKTLPTICFIHYIIIN